MDLLPLKPMSSNFTFRRSLLTDMTWSQSFFSQKFDNDSIIVRQTMACCNIAREDLTINFTEDFQHFWFQVLVGNITRNAWSISDSSLTKFSLNLLISSRASVFTLVYCSTLFWSNKVIPINSFFDNSSNVTSV